MQTFLPFADFYKSAESLDYRRLGKQRSEVLGMLTSFVKYPDDYAKGYRQHPAMWMWWGHYNQLVQYGIAICETWRKMGYKDTCLEKIGAFYDRISSNNDLPFWYGDERVHKTHQCMLVRKAPAFYEPKFPNVDPSVEYLWPDNRYQTFWSK